MAEAIQVIVSNESGLAQEIVSGVHRWRADEPPPYGSGTGPSPIKHQTNSRTEYGVAAEVRDYILAAIFVTPSLVCRM
jgi:hypothetical protein